MKTKLRRPLEARVPTQIRMRADLKDRVRKYQKRLREETGVETTFSAAVQALIGQALVEKGLKAR